MKLIKKRFTFLVIVLCMAFILGEMGAVAEETGSTAEVSKPEEFTEALKNQDVTKIKLTSSITIGGTFVTSKTILLNSKTLTVSSGVVTFSGLIDGKASGGTKGKINATSGTVVLLGTTSGVKFSGNVRKPLTLRVDAPDGTVTAVSYSGSSSDDDSNFNVGRTLSNGYVTLYVLVNNEISKEPKMIRIGGNPYYKITPTSGKRYIEQKPYTVTLIMQYPDKEAGTKEIKGSTIKNLSLPTTVKSENGNYIVKTMTNSETGAPQASTIEAGDNDKDLTVICTLEVDKSGGDMPGGKGGGAGGRGSMPSGGMTGAATDDTVLLDENGEVIDESTDETTETEPTEGMPGEGGPGGSSGSSGRGKRISVASEKTKTTFTESAPKTENVGVTIEADTAQRTRLLVIGGGIVLAAFVLLILVRRIGKR